MSLRYLDKISTWQDLVSFKQRRFWRLYPLHLITLLILVACEVLKLGLIEFSLHNPIQPPFTESKNIESLILNVFLLQNILEQKLSWNEPSWSISAEFLAYTVFGVLLFLLAKVRPWLYLVSGVIVLVSAVYLWSSIVTFSGPLRCLQAFFLGVFVHSSVDHTSWSWLGRLAGPSLLLSVMAVIFFTATGGPSNIFFPFLFASNILFLVKADPKSVTYQFLSLFPLVHLGRISYSVYMIHGILWYFLAVVLRLVFKIPYTPNSDQQPIFQFESVWAADLVMLWGLLMLLLIAHHSYYRIEQRYRFKHESIQ